MSGQQDPRAVHNDGLNVIRQSKPGGRALIVRQPSCRPGSVVVWVDGRIAREGNEHGSSLGVIAFVTLPDPTRHVASWTVRASS